MLQSFVFCLSFDCKVRFENVIIFCVTTYNTSTSLVQVTAQCNHQLTERAHEGNIITVVHNADFGIS